MGGHLCRPALTTKETLSTSAYADPLLACALFFTLSHQVINKLSIATPHDELVDGYLLTIAEKYGLTYTPPERAVSTHSIAAPLARFSSFLWR
jgi:hypothetical protein